MSRDYPRVVEAQYMAKWIRQRERSGLKHVEHNLCIVCDSPATHKSYVQVNWFRGDDEGPFKACKVHRADAYALLSAAEAAAIKKVQA